MSNTDDKNGEEKIVDVCTICGRGFNEQERKAGYETCEFCDGAMIDVKETTLIDSELVFDDIEAKVIVTRTIVLDAIRRIRQAGKAVGISAEDVKAEIKKMVTPGPSFLNKYRCPDCKTEWASTDEGQPEDDCGKCGLRHIMPYDSEEAPGQAAGDLAVVGSNITPLVIPNGKGYSILAAENQGVEVPCLEEECKTCKENEEKDCAEPIPPLFLRISTQDELVAAVAEDNPKLPAKEHQRIADAIIGLDYRPAFGHDWAPFLVAHKGQILELIDTKPTGKRVHSLRWFAGDACKQRAKNAMKAGDHLWKFTGTVDEAPGRLLPCFALAKKRPTTARQGRRIPWRLVE